MKLMLASLSLVLLSVYCDASLETTVQKAQQIERLQTILERIMSSSSYTRPSQVYRYRGTRGPVSRHHPHGPHHRRMPHIVNVNLKVDQPADRKGNVKIGGVAIFQKDYDRTRTGELEAHWHTVKKEVIINANTNVTRIKSVDDDGEIKKTLGAEIGQKVRSLKAAKIEGRKSSMSVLSPRHKKDQSRHKEKKEKERQAEKAQQAKERIAFQLLYKKYMSATIPRIGETASTTTTTVKPAPAAV